MRYEGKLAIGLYVALAFVWVNWVLDRQLFFGSDVAAGIGFVVLALVHAAVGFAIGRDWAALLPLVTVAIAAPLGYPSANKGEPWPIWLGLVLWVPLWMLVVAIGGALRRRCERRRFA